MPATVSSISPVSLPVGPPDDVVLHVYGTGFEADSQIRFGVTLERTDHYGATELSTVITAGMFPSQDPTVNVSVYNPSDATESNALTFAFVLIAPPPADGTLVADLATLKAYVGARTTTDDVVLQQRLDAAAEYVYEHTYSDQWAHVDVQEVILMRASRLYKRRQSPEGVGGFAGVVTDVRVTVGDPDEEALIDRHRDWKRVGGIG